MDGTDARGNLIYQESEVSSLQVFVLVVAVHRDAYIVKKERIIDVFVNLQTIRRHPHSTAILP